jgi:hypothetical protein
MDQFSAHLDRGWDLVQRGDTRGAEASARARSSSTRTPRSPQPARLRRRPRGRDGEEAIEAYRQAIALDDTYLEAMLNAAEVYIHPLGDYDEAIEMCDQALDLAEVDEEIIDALLLKFDALLGKGDTELAAKVVAKIPDGPYDNPNHTFLVGRAYYEIGQADKAAALIERRRAEGPAARRGAVLPGPDPRRKGRCARRHRGLPPLARSRRWRWACPPGRPGARPSPSWPRRPSRASTRCCAATSTAPTST